MPPQPEPATPPPTAPKPPGLLAELFKFLRENKKWWLLPMVLMLALLLLVVILGAAPEVAPFIYNVGASR